MLAVCLWCGLLLSTSAEAQVGASDCAREPWVELSFDGEGFEPAFQANTSEDLRAGLRLRAIQLCFAGQASGVTAPVARVIVHMREVERMLVSIEVQDAVTDKQLFRGLELQAVAIDARGLALAQAIDELLRASWVEITIREPPKSAPPPPAAIRRVFEQPALERLQVLGVRFAGEHYTGGITLLGAEALVAFWVSERLAFAFALGMRSGLSVDAPNGSVGVSALTANVSLVVPIWPRASRYNLLVSLAGHVAELTVTGRAATAARAQTGSAFVATTRLGLSGTWRLNEVLRLELTVGPGIALRGIDVTDTTRSVAGTRGVELHGALGLGGLF